MHTHSHVSKDSIAHARAICKQLKKLGFSGLALTDHDSYSGIPEMKRECKEYGLTLIEGCEIYTNLGEVIVLFATEPVSLKNKEYEVICEDARAKDGLIVVPHPYDIKRRSRLKIEYIYPETFKKFTDGVEVYNARVIDAKVPIKRAIKLKNKLNAFETGGSDAHQPRELGHSYTIIPNDYSFALENVDELKKVFQDRKVIAGGKTSNPLVHLVSFVHKWSKIVNHKLTGRPKVQ
jgi:predicted metal-dependent phosphoesterase TrpH